MTPNALLSAGVLIHFGEPDWNLKSLVNAARCPLKGGDCCLVILTPGFYLGRRRAQPGPHPNRLAGALQALPEVPGGNPLYRGVSPSFDDSHGLGSRRNALGGGGSASSLSRSCVTEHRMEELFICCFPRGTEELWVLVSAPQSVLLLI